MAGILIPISSTTLGSSAASVTFSSIPQTYTDLIVRCSTRSVAGTPYEMMAIQLNGSAAANYSETFMWGTGSIAVSTRDTAQTYSYPAVTSCGADTANTFGTTEIIIPNYTSAAYKLLSIHSAQETNNATARLGPVAGLWSQTTAVSSIVLTVLVGTSFAAGSTFHLYGIK